MQAIQTKYHGPSAVKGSRIIAAVEQGKVIVPYDHSLNAEENHKVAANTLAAKLGWTGEFYGKLVSGFMSNGSYCHVFTMKEFN